MTTLTDPPAAADDRSDDPSRPRPGPGVRADLVETGAGWILSLNLDHRTVEAMLHGLTDQGPHVVRPRDMRVSITPNLVPGEPFTLAAVEITIDDPR